LVADGTRAGLVVSLAPSGTAAVTEARLRAVDGDPLAEDPGCAYQPGARGSAA
jgi:hypothetical protein